jgi:saccharopine dehydrogenase-like NADP-dependent oxidoreductase
MKKVAVFGSGMVSRPAIRTLLDTGHRVCVATDQPDAARKLLDGHSHGSVREADAARPKDVRAIVRDADLAVSLLPVAFHVRVAEACVAERRPLVTTSYVSPEMRALDADAQRAGVILLNEVGADPGIDHMQAMRLMDRVRDDGGRITGFRSLCGGIPAPDADDNPLHYKVSWSPRGVVLAGMRPARYIEDGSVREVQPIEVFGHPAPIEIEGIGRLESYPNGDSTRFTGEYGLAGVDTLVRGTLRWPGWCAVWSSLLRLGWVTDAPDPAVAGSTHAQEMLRAAGGRPGETPRAAAARVLRLGEDDDVLRKLDWLGLFSELPIPRSAASRADVLVSRMQERLQYAPGERDLLVMHHQVDWTDRDGRPRTLFASTTEYGVPGGDSAMSRTVGIPAAFAARRILDGTIRGTGVRIPTSRDIYEPVLADLAGVGIRETVRSG